MGRVISIPIFDGGLVTNMDAEDISESAATQSVNFELDVPGKLRKRRGSALSATITGHHLSKLIKWTNDKLSNPIWVSYETQSSKIYTYTSAFGSPTEITELSTGTPSDISILDFGLYLRFGNGLADKAGIYQYIDRHFFLGNFTTWAGTSSAGFHYDQASPKTPATWNVASVSHFGSGANKAGHYYYKITPVFDGNQEAPLSDGVKYYELTSAAEGGGRNIRVQLNIDKDNWNPRITAVKVYRSYSEDNIAPVYNHIRTIPVNTKSGHSDKKTQATAVMIGKFLYKKNEDFTQATYNAYEQVIFKNVTYTISSKNNNYLVLDSSVADTKQIYGENFTLRDNDGEEADLIVTDGWAGPDLLIDLSWSWKDGELINWVADLSTSSAYPVIDNWTQVVKINQTVSTSYHGTGNTVDFINGYNYIYSTAGDNVVDLYFHDYGYPDGAGHPLEGKEKVVVNYKYAVETAGRQYVGNVRLDPDGDAEDHPDWIIYSELNQPDILPIVNYIALKDVQGGAITGMSVAGGDVIVFMERGVFRLSVPAANPAQWSVFEQEPNRGCIAPNSILTVSDMTFYAGTENAYMLSSGFSTLPITEPIKDIYQGSSNLQNTRLSYDAKKQRLLCRFGDTKTSIYALDLLRLQSGKVVWNQIDVPSARAVDIIAADENLNLYTVYNKPVS